MNFPSFGDADGYQLIGDACARSIQAGDAGGCLSSIRPIGIIAYYALPNLLSQDPTIQNYLTLFLNIIFFFILYRSGIAILSRQHGYAQAPRASQMVVASLLFASVLAITIGSIPVRLSDHQSLAMFTAAVALLSYAHDNPKPWRFVAAGFCAGLAVLFKQNYAVAAFILVLLWIGFAWRSGIKSTVRQVLWFCLGASVMTMQFLATYYQSGVFWLYNPAELEVFATSNRQPYVELTAYTDPLKSAYNSALSSPVSGLEYFAVKFYHGVSRFYWAIYLGKAPFISMPVVLQYSKLQLYYFQVVVLLSFLFSLSAVFFAKRWLALFTLTAFFTMCVGVAIGHTENRYFYVLRFAFMLYLAELTCRAANGLHRASERAQHP